MKVKISHCKFHISSPHSPCFPFFVIHPPLLPSPHTLLAYFLSFLFLKAFSLAHKHWLLESTKYLKKKQPNKPLENDLHFIEGAK